MTSVAEPVATFKKRGAKAKANIRKREATPPPADNSDSSDFSSSEDEAGHRVKRRKRNTQAVVAASSKDTKSQRSDWGVGPAEVDRSIPISDSNDATKQSNWYEKDEGTSKSARAKPADGDRLGPDGTYKGLANQTSYIEKNPDRQSRAVGPVKAPTNIRTITVTDFAPDVCKDYKNTGEEPIFFAYLRPPSFFLLEVQAY